MPVENPPLLCPPPTVMTNTDVTRHCQLSPGWGGVQNRPWLRITGSVLYLMTSGKLFLVTMHCPKECALVRHESHLTQVHTALQIRYDLSEPWQCSLLWFSRCPKIGGPLRRGSCLGHLTVSVWAEEELYRFLSATTKSLLHRRFNLLCSHHPLVTSWDRIERDCDRMNTDSFCFVSVHVYTFH